MNYQQDQGYYEINPVYHVYGDMHPSDEQIYLTKGLEIAAVYGATKLWPEYEKEILSFATGVTFAFIAGDKMSGIEMKVRF